MPEAARLSLDALNARLKVAPAPKRLSLDDLNRRLVPPSEPAEPIPTSRTARLKAYQSAMDQQSALVSPPAQTMMGREQFARALEQMNRPSLGERFMEHGREGFANTLAGQGLLNARSSAIEKSRADTLDRIIANARQQGSNVGVPLPPITDRNTGAALSDPNRDASDLVGDYVGVPLADLEHKAKTARARYNVQSRPVLEAERQRQAEFAAMQPAQGLLERGAAVAGALAGSAPSPENLIPVGRGATVAETLGKGFLAGSAAAGLTDPIIQGSQVGQGLRQEYDPSQTVFAALAGGALSGVLNVAPDIILPVVRQIAARLRKSPEQVTVGELTAEMGGRPPEDSAGAEAPPPATTMGPTGDLAPPASPGAVGESVSAPRSPFVAHVVSQPTRPSGPQVYQGGIRGPAFEAGGRGTAPAAAPARPTASAPSSTPSGEIIVTPRGRKIGAQYEVVELGDLTPSHTDDMSVNPRFPAELQPRARERAASQAQVAEIAGNLEPSLLGRSASASEGAPIIGPDGVVESGNGRVLALGRAYSQGMPGAVNYRAWLQAQGFNVEGMKQPVLVRRRTTELSPADRQAFTREANERTTLTPSASEQAMADARNLSDQSLDYYQGGELHAGANRNFIRTFIDSVVPPSERGGMFDKTGAISQDGLRRVENALFAKAYEDAGILGRLREDTDTNIRAIGNALVDTAPAWASLRADARAGRIRPEMDITPALVEAANIVGRARQQGLPVADLVNQVDMFGGPNPQVSAILRLMFRDPELRRPVSRQKLRDSLAYYADQARRATAGSTLDLGDVSVTPADILGLASSRGTGDLLPEAAEMRGTAYSMRPDAGQGRLSLDALNARLTGQPRRLSLAQLNSTLAMTPGANYVGAAPQTFNPAVPRATGDVIRRETILRDLMTALGVPLYQGRIKSAKTLGFYRPGREEVRVKAPGDIETTAHEIAHLLDDRIPEIRRQWNPATAANARVRAELAGVSYDKTKLYEGFAEFVRLWATQPNQVRARAPLFNAWFESFINRSEYGPALREMQRDMLNWFEQAAVDRAASKIGEGPDINSGLVSPLAKFRQTVVDDLQGIKSAELGVTGKLSPVGAYETARLTRGKAAIIEGALTLGVPVVNNDGSHSYRGKGLQQIFDPVAGDLDNFLMYAVGRSAHELKAQGRENLFTPAEISGMLALEKKEFRKAFDQYQDWNKGIVDFAEAKGIINPAVRQQWKRAAYVPFYRIGEGGGAKASKGTPGEWQGIKALRGGRSNLRPILGNIIQNASMLIDAALTNEARLAVADLAGMKGGARFLAKIPKEDASVNVSSAEVERAILDALGVKSAKALTPEQQMVFDDITNGLGGFVKFILRGQSPKGKNVVAALRHGQPEFYEVADPLLYRAITSLNRPARGWVMRALSMPKNIGQLTITLAADFMAANIVRDTISAGIFSQHGFRPFVDSAKGFVSRLRKDNTYKEFIANGGGLSSHLLDESNYRRHLEKFYTRKGIDYRTVLDAPAKLLDGIQHIADAFEMATRLGEYQRSIAKGQHPRHAAYSAREVSTDFAMRGDQSNDLGKALAFAYDTIIFLKAGVVSLDRFARGVAEDPNKASIAIKTGLLAAMSTGLYAMNRGNPLYEQLEDYDRDGHWHFFVPTPETIKAWSSGQPLPPLEDRFLHLRLPKIWEIGGISSIAERQLQGILDGEPLKAQTDSLRIIANLFGFEYLPQFIAPFAESAMNRDRFTGRPIETQAMQELEPFARSNAYTSSTVRALGEATRPLPPALQLSPAKVEHLLRGLFNTWALYGLAITDKAFFPGKPDSRTDQLPVVRRFFRQEPAQSTRYVEDLYEAIDAATKARNTARFMVKTYRPEIGQEMARGEDVQLYSQLNSADERMRGFRKMSEAMTGAPDLEATQRLASQWAHSSSNKQLLNQARGIWSDQGALKRLIIDDITRERNAYAEAVMGSVNQRREQMRAGQ